MREHLYTPRIARTGLFVIICASTLTVCSKEDNSWFMDVAYSHALLIGAQYYHLKVKNDSSTTVDTLQIYSTKSEDSELSTLREIRGSHLIFESSDRDFIAHFFQAARTGADGRGCEPLHSQVVLHILAFDHDLMRVAYFRYYDCSESGTGAIAEAGTWSIVFTSELATLLKPLRSE